MVDCNSTCALEQFMRLVQWYVTCSSSIFWERKSRHSQHTHTYYVYTYLFHIVYQKRATAHFPATSLVTNIMKLTHAEWKQKRVEMTWRQDESIQFKTTPKQLKLNNLIKPTYLSTLSNWNGLFKTSSRLGPRYINPMGTEINIQKLSPNNLLAEDPETNSDNPGW